MVIFKFKKNIIQKSIQLLQIFIVFKITFFMQNLNFDYFCELHPRSILLNESGHLEIPTGTLRHNRTFLHNTVHYHKSTSLIQSAEGSTTQELKNEITHFSLMWPKQLTSFGRFSNRVIFVDGQRRTHSRCVFANTRLSQKGPVTRDLAASVRRVSLNHLRWLSLRN